MVYNLWFLLTLDLFIVLIFFGTNTEIAYRICLSLHSVDIVQHKCMLANFAFPFSELVPYSNLFVQISTTTLSETYLLYLNKKPTLYKYIKYNSALQKRGSFYNIDKLPT